MAACERLVHVQVLGFKLVDVHHSCWANIRQQLHPGIIRVLFFSEADVEFVHVLILQELPYALTVQADSVKPLLGSRQGLAIHVTVFVKNRLMRSIVVGKGGSIIQGYVAQPTEAELARILGAPVKLTVSVKSLADG
jgi:GTPase Era involved in 16S rRNA processing